MGKIFPPCNKSISVYYEQNSTAKQEYKMFMKKKGQFLPEKSILFIYQQNYHIPSNTEICFKWNWPKTEKRLYEILGKRKFKTSGMWCKMKALQTFEIFGTTHQMTQHHISGTSIFINMIVTAEPNISWTWIFINMIMTAEPNISGTWIFINMIVTAEPKWLK